MSNSRGVVGDSDPFLTMIDARLMALQQLRASYVAARAAGAIGNPGDVLPAFGTAAPEGLSRPDAIPHTPDPADVRNGRTRRLPRGAISAHVRSMVSETTRPLRVREMVASLRERGVTSASLSVTIHGILNRLRHGGQVVRTDAGWIANADQIVPANSPAPIAAAKPAPSRPRRARRPRPQTSEPAPDQRPDGLAWRIESLLKSHGEPVAARYVAQATGEPLNVVGLTLGRMVRQQRVERQPDGQFAVVVPMSTGHDGTDTTSNGQAN